MALLDTGALDEIRFSVDGGSREQFEELRKGAKWEGVSSNIRSFVKLNGGGDQDRHYLPRRLSADRRPPSG